MKILDVVILLLPLVNAQSKYVYTCRMQSYIGIEHVLVFLEKNVEM